MFTKTQYLSKNKIKVFESAIEKLARILAEKYKIKVIFRHDMCMTDGRTIYLPVIPENASDEFLGAVQGYLDHEVAHLIFSDFELIKNLEHKSKKKWHVVQALEDIRIEEAMRKLWRGAGVNLKRCNEWSLKQLKEQWYNLSEFGRWAQGSLATGMLPDDHWFLKDVVNDDVCVIDDINKVKHIFRDAINFPDTATVFEKAQEVLDIIGAEDEEEQPPQGEQNEPQPESGQGESQGAPDKQQQEEQQQGESSGEGEGEQEEQQQQVQPQQGNPSGQKEMLSVSDEELDKDQQIASTSEMIRQVCKSEMSDQDDYLIYTTEGDVMERITDGDREKAQDFLKQSRALVNVIYKRMRLNLLSYQQDKWEPGKRRGKIDPRAVFRVPIGTSKKVFRKRVQAPSFNTRCSLWIDHSGSMEGYKLNLAAKSAMLFGEVLNELGIPFEICGYSTTSFDEGKHRYSQATPEERDMFARWGNLWVGIYKSFDDDWRHTRHRCYEMTRHYKCNTFDGESIRLAASRLIQYPETRKILFVFNDGCPCPNVGQKRSEHVRYCKEMAREIESVVELFAVGICSPYVGDLYTNHVEIDDIDELPKVMIEKLDALLRKGKTLLSAAV